MVVLDRKMGPDCYVPILKAKQGELGALAGLEGTAKSRVLPLLEVQDGPSRAKAIASNWMGGADAILIQPVNLDTAESEEWAEQTARLFAELRSLSILAVPVATLEDEPALLAAVRSVVAADGRGLCIRLDGEEATLATGSSASDAVRELLREVSTDRSQCDLVIDVGLIRDSVAARVATAEAALRAIADLPQYRNVVVAFSAFPESAGEVAAAGAVTQISREDALAFAILERRISNIDLTYADYGVGIPFYGDIPWAPIPSIKYASGENWQIYRGTSRQNPSPQYRQLCREIVTGPHFSLLSEGDRYLEAVVSGADGPGNATTYVRVGTSRHIGCVLDRLSTIGAP